MKLRNTPWRLVAPIVAILSITALVWSAVPATAWHSIVKKHARFRPPEGVHWNRLKVFLSSPRHASSGQKGECKDPGWEENVNGRQFGWHAARGGFYWEEASSSAYRNLRESGYKATVSKNKRDGGYRNNREASENWNSNFHIVIHTNGTTDSTGSNPCQGDTKYVLAMYRSDRNRSYELATELRNRLDPVAPGTRNRWSAKDHELFTRAPWVAYLELAFHDHQPSQRWIHNKSRKSGWRLRWTIDQLKGYPR